jgi:hypothetical protein
MHRLQLTLCILCICVSPLFAQYNFDFSCLDDTIQHGVDQIEFHFRLENSGTLPDSYAFDLRIIDSVSGWFRIYCVRGMCAEPGIILYDYLDVGEFDTTIHVTIYPDTSQPGTEILNLHVASIGDPSLRDSINVYGVVASMIEEDTKMSKSMSHILKAYPNPFRNHLVIHYALCTKHYAQKDDKVPSPYLLVPTIRIYDVTGRLVKKFSLSTLDPATHPPRNLADGGLRPAFLSWDGRDEKGVRVPQGIYFVKLECSNINRYEKLIRVK